MSDLKFDTEMLPLKKMPSIIEPWRDFPTEGRWEIRGLPLPPSANGLHKSFVRKGSRKVVRVKSDAYNRYIRQMSHWKMNNFKGIPGLRKWIEKHNQGPEPLRLWVERQFMLHRSTIWTKKNTVKKFDVTNRIKALDDEISKLIGLDDSHIWGGSEEKIETNEEIPQCVNIIIRLYVPLR